MNEENDDYVHNVESKPPQILFVSNLNLSLVRLARDDDVVCMKRSEEQ